MCIRDSDRPKRELGPRNLAFVEQPDLEALRARTEIEIEQPRAEHHVHLVNLRQADDRVEIAELDPRVGFLERFAQCAALQRFAVFEKARRQRPQAMACLLYTSPSPR